jgi:hypothetical protein
VPWGSPPFPLALSSWSKWVRLLIGTGLPGGEDHDEIGVVVETLEQVLGLNEHGRIMGGQYVNGLLTKALGWLTTFVMAAGAVGLFATCGVSV